MKLSKPLDCIIIDDEDGAHLVLESHLQGLTSLNLCGNFYNAKDALDYIHKNHVDLIFLDINMPGLSGIDMLKTMRQSPFVIFTTAYSKYALESYDYDAVDYLVKPISLPRLLTSVNRVVARFKDPFIQQQDNSELPQTVTLKINNQYVRMVQQDIDYLQSWGNYVKIFINGQMKLASITTNEIEAKLEVSKFIRIHKSYIVSLSRILKVKGNEVELIGGILLPIGSTYRKKLLEII